jgi:ubiquinone/menaquinone biosynthesis C-methylase UbiE
MDKWRGEWDNSTTVGRRYGDLLYQRAVGELAEMESSKAAAKRIAAELKKGDTLLDVGCGAGHYLTSLRKIVPFSFGYVGTDASADYLTLARKAFESDSAAAFKHGDIFNLPFEQASFDVVMCNNVLLHLPTVARPLAELVRVSRRYVLVRALIGPRSYVVQCVASQENGDDFDDDGQPRAFHFLNIYSEQYIQRTLRALPRVASVEIALDREFAQSAIADTGNATKSWVATRVVDGMQVAGSIIQPWAWLQIRLKDR